MIQLNTSLSAKCPLRTAEGHFVLFAGHSSKSVVRGNGHSNGCINTFPYYCSVFKRRTILWELLV